MSWEVLTMKSKRSYFNWGVSKNLLRRCWPLWAAYFAVLLFLLPVSLLDYRVGREELWVAGASAWDRQVLELSQGMIVLSFAVGILTAMVMFHYLYNNRSCGMMNALPLRRETLFLTVYLTGLTPLLLADLLVMLLSAALFAGRGVLLKNLLIWLAMAAGTNLTFYGFAVFCAMLTGSLLILPIVYVVLNLAAPVAESCLRELLSHLIYGMGDSYSLLLTLLSPIWCLLSRVHVVNTAEDGPWQLNGLEWVGIYALLGLIFSFLALRLYRKRQMEVATDTVAIPVLKPVFRYCMSFGTALVFAQVIYSMILGGRFHGGVAALVILALLLLGAVLGWYVAEMLIQRTVRVFPGKWKGLIPVCLLLVLFVGAAELDMFGYERYVPKAGDVESVIVNSGGEWEIREPENLEKAIALHQTMIDHKRQHEGDIHVYGDWMIFRYNLKNGRQVARRYYIARMESGTVYDPSDLLAWQELLNCPELLRQYNALEIPVTEETVYFAELNISWLDEADRWQGGSLNLTPEEAVDFYRNGLLPDMEENTVGRRWLVQDEEYQNTVSNVAFYLDLRWPVGSGQRNDFAYFSTQLCLDSVHSMAWIRQHANLEPRPVGEAMPDSFINS